MSVLDWETHAGLSDRGISFRAVPIVSQRTI